MAPILFHGLNQLGLPVVCVESRQAYQALKSLANTGRKTGFWLEELAAPYYVFEDAGAPLSPKSPINGTR